MVSPNGFIFIPHFDTLKIISSGVGHVVLYESNQIALFQQSLYFRVKRNSSEHVPSLYSCNSVSTAPGSIFQHQLVKQFQIATPTLAYSYSYRGGKPSLHPSIPPSVPPLIPFHSGTIRSLSQSQPWPGAQSSARPA